jgi:plasmid stabilization system protein ParE
MKGYELSREAIADLQEIWTYIANDNVAAADKQIKMHLRNRLK